MRNGHPRHQAMEDAALRVDAHRGGLHEREHGRQEEQGQERARQGAEARGDGELPRLPDRGGEKAEEPDDGGDKRHEDGLRHVAAGPFDPARRGPLHARHAKVLAGGEDVVFVSEYQDERGGHDRDEGEGETHEPHEPDGPQGSEQRRHQRKGHGAQGAETDDVRQENDHRGENQQARGVVGDVVLGPHAQRDRPGDVRGEAPRAHGARRPRPPSA